jgi:NAD(P)H-dependent FMN reductase
MQIVAVSGSLRARSSNAAVIRAAAAVAPPGVTITLDESIGGLPYFNPDLDGEGAVPPPPVAAFRQRLATADAVLVCSPEYAHGVPGALKNALDWLVSDVALIGKHVAVITVSSSGGAHAHAQLAHTLATMSWIVVEPACLRLQLGRAQLDAEARVVDPAVVDQLRASVAALVSAARSRQSEPTTSAPYQGPARKPVDQGSRSRRPDGEATARTGGEHPRRT